MLTSRLGMAMVVLVALAALMFPLTGLARTNVAIERDSRVGGEPPVGRSTSFQSAAATPTPTVVGVMGIASRGMRAAAVSSQATACPSGSSRQGIDASQFQGSVNWSQVSQSGRSFAFARAGDGATYVDPTFSANYAGIKQAGMKAGAYLFFRPEQDPSAQANAFVATLRQAGFAPGDLVPALDVEVTDGQPGATVAENLQTTVSVVRQQLGVAPVIYTAPLWWNSYIGATSFGGQPLWTANWGVSCPGIPNGWATWSYWQYTDVASVPGVSGPVDADVSCTAGLPLYRPPTPTPASTRQYRLFLPWVFASC